MKITKEQKRMIHNIRRNVTGLVDLIDPQQRHNYRLARLRRKRIDKILKGLRRTIEV